MTTGDDDVRRSRDNDRERRINWEASDAEGRALVEANAHLGDGDRGPAVAEHIERLRRAALTTDQLKALAQPPWIIDGVLQHDSLAEIYGKPGSYKSFLAADWSLSVAAGLGWAGLMVRPSPVVYVIAEGATGMGDRVAAWEERHAARLAYVDERFPVVWLPLAVNLGSGAWGEAVGEFAAEHGAGLVVFDTRARCTVGIEENSARDMGQVVDNLDAARQISHACHLLVHHPNAFGDRPRGSTAVEGAAETEILVKVADGVATVRLEKQKNGPDGRTWTFRPYRVGPSIVLMETSPMATTEITASGRVMLDALRDIYIGEPVSFTRWSDASEVSRATFSRQVKVLMERGFVVKVGPRYEPTVGAPEAGGDDET